MHASSSPKEAFDVEAQKDSERIEVVENTSPPDVHGISYVETRVPHARRLPIEYRTLSIHVETRIHDDESSLKGKKKEEARKLAVKEFINLEWHKITVDEALARLAVSPKTGLEQAQAERRQQLHGRNLITPPRSNLWKKVLEWMLGGFGSLLLVASIVCFIAWKPLGNPNPNASNLALAVVLLIVLFLQAAFNAWQDFSTSRVMSSIKGMLPADVSVLRDSSQTKIPAKDLVPGDLVTIGLGEKIPADLRLIEVSSDLQFDRSILTGESEPVSGRMNSTDDNFLETRNVALQGTLCVAGMGIGLVIQTGDKTVFGVIAKLSSMESTGLTTLQRELLRFVLIIASLAITVALLIVFLWLGWLRKSYPDYINVPTLLIDIVSVMVAFIPEGLPVAVTLSLAKVAHTLTKKKIVCKSLSIVETLGSVNVLCSDKTGTLTQNIMHVQNVAVFDIVQESKDYCALLANATSDVKANLSQVLSVGTICNASSFEGHADTTDGKPDKRVVGNATDAAIFRFCHEHLSADVTRNNWKSVFRKNFNSKTKYMLQLSRPSNAILIANSRISPLTPWDDFKSGSFLLTLKGAPEVLLKHCTSVIDPSGGPPIPLDSQVLEKITTIQERWAGQGQRVLLLARRVLHDQYLEKFADNQPEDYGDAVEEHLSDLIIVGLLGLMDPLKPDIKHTVSVCRRAGIRVFIVTGDHPTTATSIATQAGIISDPKRVNRAGDLLRRLAPDNAQEEGDEAPAKSIVITGSDLTTFTPAQMTVLCDYEEIVFARTTPEQKLFIVESFQKLGNVVAVTGDGVNDAPSLKAAHCGIAMGDGSDVAKEAADLVLLGEFSSIVTAIEYGRLVYDNLKKTVLYLLPAGSFSELMPVLFNVILGIPQMLSNIQMIIICVGTDVLPALSLCMEPPEHGLLLRKPRNVKTDRLADWRLLLHAYGFLGVLEATCAMTMSFWYLQRQGIPFGDIVLSFQTLPGPSLPALTPEIFAKAQSIYFFTLVIMQWGNLLASRGRRLSIFQHTPFRNPYIFGAMIIALAIGIFFSYLPWFQQVFLTSGIPAQYFFIPMTFALGLLFLDETRKYFVRRYPKSFIASLAW